RSILRRQSQQPRQLSPALQQHAAGQGDRPHLNEPAVRVRARRDYPQPGAARRSTDLELDRLRVLTGKEGRRHARCALLAPCSLPPVPGRGQSQTGPTFSSSSQGLSSPPSSPPTFWRRSF